jgi:hypothetical protein
MAGKPFMLSAMERRDQDGGSRLVSLGLPHCEQF